MKRTICALLCISLILCLAACGKKTEPQKQQEQEVKQSYSDIYKAIENCRKNESELLYRAYNMGVEDSAVAVAEDYDKAAPTAPATAAADGEKLYSDTNVQVEGIDESDIVKTDGEFIYCLNNNELRIYRADGENTACVSLTKVGDDTQYMSGMYITGDSLILVATKYEICFDAKVGEDSVGYDKPQSKLLVYDVSDRAAPSYVNCVAQDGTLVSSRMYAGSVYLVSRYYVNSEINEEKPETFVPCIYRDDEVKAAAADSICIMPDTSAACYTVVTKYDVESGAQENLSVLGSSDTVYMSTGSLYIAAMKGGEETVKEYVEDAYKVTEYRDYSETELCRIDLASMKAVATAKVPGNLESQFSMDEYNGNLRLVTTDNEYSYTIYYDEKHDFTNYVSNDDGKSSTGLYILDSGLNQIAAIEGLAENEYVRSVRFDGDFVYFCTFRQVDPLFAVNVADPKNPKILSEYKISGFSEYLHAWSDGRLFGLGLEADEETGRTEGMKLVMFDVSDKADVKALHTAGLEKESWSEALYDHHALLISPEKGIIGFAAGSEYVIYGYSDENGFAKLASVALGEECWNSRGLYIGDYAYIINTDGVKVLDMNSFEYVMGCKAAT